MQNFDRYPPICNRLSILHIGRYVSAGRITDTEKSVLPIWAISADTDMPTLILTETYMSVATSYLIKLQLKLTASKLGCAMEKSIELTPDPVV